MPLVTCPECGHPVSAAAAACPSCGHPIAPAVRTGMAPRGRERTLMMVVGAAIAGVALLALAGWFTWRRLEARAEAQHQRRQEELVDFQEVPPPAPPAAVSSDRTRELAEVEEQPEMLDRERIAAELSRNYPPVLRDAGVEGSATLRIRILEDGSVDPDVRLVEASHPMFGEAAVRMARGMRFRPARVGGQPVAVWAQFPVDFRLRR